ncbi:hypothetical protein LPJ66_002928 [Kickxella alabastrina]|uniref:Uncharacterized protein n=1 Tax=Kickxella alabastrina TaxID=61397 RepID=A0ACC1IN09_9FUNG|nr:hypothetical protein LPJ66_002928 [Kickxella alabastrina]
MSGPFGLPLPLLTDSYKTSHAALFPAAQKAVAYAEFRHGFGNDSSDERMVFYGLQYIVDQYINRQWTAEDVEMSSHFFSTHNTGHTAFPFPKELFLKFISENNGHFPVRIEAMAEGSVVYPHTVVMQITAEREYSGLVTYLESVLLMAWYPSTVATLSRRSKTAINEYYRTSVDENMRWTLDSRMHDFGFRACTCVEQSMLGGAAHLLSFGGTDTLTAAYYVQQRLNGGRAVATSIPATEHSVMTAFGSERQAVLRLLEVYGDGVVACVMDSYDYARALEEVLPAVATAKLERGGVLIIRPDSGDQVETVLMGLRAAERVFGADVNGLGFRVIRGAGVIQGDGVTTKSLARILAAVHAAGYAAQNVAFGMGGGLLQKVNRDTMSMAVKLSSVTYASGETRDIMKFPRAGSEKVSLPGCFSVHADATQHGAPVVYRQCDAPDARNLLEVVYDCGPVPGRQWDSFDDVRRRVDEQWRCFPPRINAVSALLLAHQKAVHIRQAQDVDGGAAFA